MSHLQHHSPLPSNESFGLTLPPEEYRQLTIARSPARMRAYLAAIGTTNRTDGAPPACHLLDMKYAPSEQCTLLYQWGEQFWIGLLPWQKAPPTDHAYHLASLGLWLYPFPHDPALPALATVLDDSTVTEQLRAGLPFCQEDEQEVVRAHATPLRYRPGKRCTIQIDLLLRSRRQHVPWRQRFYGKLYHDRDKAAAVYDEMHLLTNAVAASGCALTLATAVAFVPTLNLVLQAPVTGQPLDLLLQATASDADSRAVERAAQALATLHRLPVTTVRLRPAVNDVAKLSRRAAKVATVAPAIGETMVALAEQLTQLAVHLPAWGATTSIGHGDCKPSQFLLSAEQVALLDFDHCGMADPAADVALFLATLRQGRIQQQTRTHRQPAAGRGPDDVQRNAFYTAYTAAVGACPGFAQRVAWYEGLALLRKAWRSFARSPWSPLPMLLIEEGRRGLARIAM